ncbi:Major facilitator superfamily domain containing protein [Amanita muscaria]
MRPSIKEKVIIDKQVYEDLNAEFGGTEARKVLERKLLIKLDMRMSILLLIYVLNQIDRNNVSAARLRGFEVDLRLKGQEFATLLSIFYVGYIIMQVPSNMFLNYIGRPSLYLPMCTMIWGIISCLTGTFVETLLTRFFLGFVEATFFPGAVFLLSKWYKREEIGLRTAAFICGISLSNAFGALVASGILESMEGKLGRPAWRWLFLIEGSLTIFVAIVSIFVLPDFPMTTRWLSPQERALALKRMEEDTGVGDEGDGNGIWLAITDWKLWWLAVAVTSQTVALTFNIYFPTLTATLGYNPTISLLLVAPPFIFTAIFSVFLAHHSDKMQERFWHLTGSVALGTLGFTISITTMNVAARYVSMFLIAQTFTTLVLWFAWISSSLARPPSKRAASLAFVNAFAQLANVAGSYIWPTRWGPSYRLSYVICITASGGAIAMAWIFRMHLKRLNKRIDGDGVRFVL